MPGYAFGPASHRDWFWRLNLAMLACWVRFGHRYGLWASEWEQLSIGKSRRLEWRCATCGIVGSRWEESLT